MPIYNKLVRDTILEIIKAEGLNYNARILTPDELLVEIKEKMIEEAHEFKEAVEKKEAVEELADILELIHASLGAYGVDFEELEGIRQKKKEKRGGFEKAIYLIDVED
ncbi:MULTISPECIES: nucleoside triphosphate pyrophosphohydrolase [Bacillus cereus group]|uniref:nucleoside triphosphate pyrophosphohydrolase n=1 Tax=Bacillus cereus group TaxID=86661 RepID=UPI0007B6C22D|nr:nucleoside triphosphate pyrophosphohydrolase [Bacillus cereus]ANC11269.1 phosphoribosyl-ATP pyrophosphohydrolase [Bacillus cereus]ANC16966.1 phosphoribosyl-ATP pyrophosphohydrolase [Bacillus cereus]MDA1994843.1 nucleoside triphosphate pyrophosphohydrolase [Bacillus cereus]MDA2000963.1 nucleoside triphosphate pyrophosphohydrolase [Bacillus cereus]MDA3654148.1 nucleoside triphosphate pyrophosphohydrolase [Bacillus cereus]